MIVSILEHDPIRFSDGSVESFRVRLLNDDRTVSNTGRGFQHSWEAELFADGLGMALGRSAFRENVYEGERVER
jgi:hypothetical protein